MNYVKCPCCGKNDKIQKGSSIYEQSSFNGTIDSKGNIQGLTIGTGGLGLGLDSANSGSEVHIVSDLGKKFAPPENAGFFLPLC